MYIMYGMDHVLENVIVAHKIKHIILCLNYLYYHYALLIPDLEGIIMTVIDGSNS